MFYSVADFKELTKADGLMWWCFRQNNSGGYFIRNSQVDDCVFVQAKTHNEAMQMVEEAIDDNSEWCECCGERWSIEYDDESNPTPMYYSDCAFSKEAGIHSRGGGAIFYFNDGRIARWLGVNADVSVCQK